MSKGPAATGRGGGGVRNPADGQQRLAECKFCGRKFAPDMLEKHLPICTKATLPRRPTFDSYNQRISGTELQGYRAAPSRSRPPPKNNWRQKHEELVSAIENGRKAQHAIATGQPLPPPPPASIDPSYIQCQYCGRRFNEAAAERHIPYCKSKQGDIASVKSARSNTSAPGGPGKPRGAATPKK